jgi:hypothetical protein
MSGRHTDDDAVTSTAVASVGAGIKKQGAIKAAVWDALPATYVGDRRSCSHPAASSTTDV